MTRQKSDILPLNPARDTLPAPVEPDSQTTAMIKSAIEHNIDVEKLERLVALHERATERQARAEFNAALTAFQNECPSIPRTKKATTASGGGAGFSYNYADMDGIASIIRPLMEKHGLSVTWDSDVKDGQLRCTCTVQHIAGHSQSATFVCPTESRAGMSAAQKVASALTFARRLSLVQALGLITGEPDIDGAEHDPQTITESEAADLDALLDEVKANRPAFLKHFGIGCLAEMPARRMKEAHDMIQRKRSRP